MDEQDRQDGNYLVLLRDLSSTRRFALNSPTIVDRKETCTRSCLSCSSLLVPLPKARSVISKNCTAPGPWGKEIHKDAEKQILVWLAFLLGRTRLYLKNPPDHFAPKPKRALSNSTNWIGARAFGVRLRSKTDSPLSPTMVVPLYQIDLFSSNAEPLFVPASLLIHTRSHGLSGKFYRFPTHC
jgi:hypothetical protein